MCTVVYSVFRYRLECTRTRGANVLVVLVVLLVLVALAVLVVLVALVALVALLVSFPSFACCYFHAFCFGYELSCVLSHL